MRYKILSIPLILYIATLICFALYLGRLYDTGSIRFLFLVWNLFLAWIPVLPALALQRVNYKSQKGKLLVVGLLSSWLLFFPNCPYILTDFVHLRNTFAVPLWYDLILISSFALLGLILGFYSLLHIHKFLEKVIQKAWIRWTFICSLLGLSSFGVYLGRFERWNSWDIMTQPQSIFSDIFSYITEAPTLNGPFGFTIAFTAFLFIGYATTFYFTNFNESYERAAN